MYYLHGLGVVHSPEDGRSSIEVQSVVGSLVDLVVVVVVGSLVDLVVVGSWYRDGKDPEAVDPMSG